MTVMTKFPEKKPKNQKNLFLTVEFFPMLSCPISSPNIFLPLERGQDQVDGSRRGNFLKFFQKTNKRLKYL